MENSSQIPFITHRGVTITTCDGDLSLGTHYEFEPQRWNRYILILQHTPLSDSQLIMHLTASDPHSYNRNSKYGIYVLNPVNLEMGHMALRRMIKVAQDTDAAMVYCDHYNRLPNDSIVKHPVIDCQEGSLRDDFDFGPVVMINCDYLFKACMEIEQDFKKLEYAGFYAVRLALSRLGKIVSIHAMKSTCVAVVSASLTINLRRKLRSKKRWRPCALGT